MSCRSSAEAVEERRASAAGMARFESVEEALRRIAVIMVMAEDEKP